MADVKITALAENAAPISTDILPMVDDPAGTPVTKKVTIANLLAVGNHVLLSATHTDTLADTVVRGDIIIGNSTPVWARLPIGGGYAVLQTKTTYSPATTLTVNIPSADAAYATAVTLSVNIPAGSDAAYATAVSLSVNIPVAAGAAYSPAVTLNGAIDNVVTSVVVNDSSAIEVNDIILCQSEKMKVTANNGGTETLTVVRGVGGSSAASHATATAVTQSGTSFVTNNVTSPEVNDIALIDSEKMKITASDAVNTILTVVRAVGGSTGAAHAASAAVIQSSTSFVTDNVTSPEVSDVLLVQSEKMKVTARDATNIILTVVRAVGGSSAATHAASTAVTQSGTSFVYTSTGDPVDVGDIILIDSEQMETTAEDTTNDILTVSRAYGGTSAAAHAASASLSPYVSQQMVWRTIPYLAGVADTSGITRVTLDVASPQLTLTGDTKITTVAAIACTPASNIYLNIAPVSVAYTGSNYFIQISPSGATLTSGTLIGVYGAPVCNVTGTNSTIRGLSFAAYVASTGTITELTGVYCQIGCLSYDGAITSSYGVYIAARYFAGSAGTIATAYGIRIGNQGTTTATDVKSVSIDNITAGTNRYGIIMADITAGTIARILELGPTPYLRLLGSGNWTPAANTTPLWVAEGATPTLRQLKTFDPGNLGINFVAGQLVCLLV